MHDEVRDFFAEDARINSRCIRAVSERADRIYCWNMNDEVENGVRYDIAEEANIIKCEWEGEYAENMNVQLVETGGILGFRW